MNVSVSGTVYKVAPTAHVTGFATGVVTTANIPLAWTAASPAPDGYLIKVSSSTIANPVDGTDSADDLSLSDGVAQARVTPGGSTAYSSFTGFVAGTSYTFSIFPYNNSGAQIRYLTSSAPSLAASLALAAPASVSLSSDTISSFSASWAAVASAVSYQLDVASDNLFTSLVTGYNALSVSSTNQAVTGLAPNSTYFVRARAVNGTGSVSANSPTNSVTTLHLPPPATGSLTGLSDSGFTLNWSAVTGATGYRADVYTGVWATDLIISEYIEGSSNNKYVEIYNGTGRTVDLSDYELRLYGNGSNIPTGTQLLSALSGGPTTLAHGACLVLRNSGAVLALPAGVTAYPSGTINYNGDDALAIWKKSTASLVDVFGTIGFDPGNGWTSGSFNTVDKTLTRNAAVTAGITVSPTNTFDALPTEWTQSNVDIATGLGSHTMNTTGAFLSGYENVDAGIGNSLIVTGVSPVTTYNYRIRATSPTSTSGNSAIQSVTTPKADPVISAWPNASQINFGQALSAATLSGGASTPGGNFAFAAPTTVPSKIGLSSYSVIFTPSDSVNFNPATNNVSVTVNQVIQTVYGRTDNQNFQGFTTADLLDSANGWSSSDGYTGEFIANGFTQNGSEIFASIGNGITTSPSYRMTYDFEKEDSDRLVFTWTQVIERSDSFPTSVDRFGWEFRGSTNNVLFALKMVQFEDTRVGGTPNAWDRAEDFVDGNGNGRYDGGESFTDTNGDGIWNPAEPLAEPANDRPGGYTNNLGQPRYVTNKLVVAGYDHRGDRLGTDLMPNLAPIDRGTPYIFRVIVDLREDRWWAQIFSGGAFQNLMGDIGAPLPPRAGGAPAYSLSKVVALWELNDTTLSDNGTPGNASDDTDYEFGGSNVMLFDDFSIQGRKIVHLGLSTPSGAIYNGTAQGASFTEDITNAAQITYSLQYSGVTNTTVPINAGTYIATVGVNTNTTPYFAVVGTNSLRLYTNSAILTQSYTIDRKPVTITNVSVANKIYDGNTNATITGTPVIDGKEGSDDVTVAGGTANFFTADAGPAKLAEIKGYSLTGTAAPNYLLTGMPISASAEISQKTLNVTAQAKTKVYGENDPALTYLSSGLVGSDSISGSLARVAGEDAGIYAIQQNTLDAGPNYQINFTGANLSITRSTPTVTTAPTASAITYGQTLASSTLSNGVASVAGLFDFTDPTTAPAAGTANQSVTFTPANTNNHNSFTLNVSVTVNPATPTITWTNPAPITYGVALSSTQLNATSSVAGTFTYSPTNGAVLNAGTNTLTAVFSATDSNNYVSQLTNTVTVVVNQATPTIIWTNPAAITYGTALSSTQLNATADVDGAFEYNPTNGAVLNVGTNLLSVVFTPANTNNYISPITNTVSVVVNQATPTITWTNPAAITYGTALSSTQLNATSDAAGSFTYSPSNGAVLNVGTNTLTTVFTADDSTNYVSPLTNTVSVVVNQATPMITWTNPAAITYGTALSSTQLNATSSVAGTFTYSPTNGAVLNAGTNTLTAVFTATDSTNFVSPVTNNVSLVVNKATQTITGVAATVTKTVGDASYSVGGTVGSGLPLAYSSSTPGVATVDATSGAVTIVAPGSTTITVSQAGNSNYEAATSVTQVLTVNAATTPAEDYLAGFGLTGTNAALTADPDGDGLSNAQEFAFGAVPNVAGSLPITTSNTGGTLKMVFLGRTNGVTYNVLTYTNLKVAAVSTNPPTESATQPTNRPTGYKQYEATVDSSTGTRKFMKVDAVIP